MLLVISADSSLKQSGWPSKELCSITVLCAAVLKGSYFYLETRYCFLESRKVVYLVYLVSPPLSWGMVINRVLPLCRQCSLCLPAAAVTALSCGGWVTAGAGCASLPTLSISCTSSFPFSQESFCICFIYSLFVSLSSIIKGYKNFWKHPHSGTMCTLFLRKHTGGHLLFILTAQA